MLRRIPSTSLVCLVVLASITFISTAWAADPEQALEILLKPEKGTGSSAAKAPKAVRTPAYAPERRVSKFPAPYRGPRYPKPITKVKPGPPPCGPAAWGPPCVIPKLRQGQWNWNFQAIFARIRGRVIWPRNSQFFSGFNQENIVDFNDDLKVPEHMAVGQFQARYQFRPNWGIRYTGLGGQYSGSGFAQENFWFGNQQFSQSTDVNTKWDHGYHRSELIYDAVKTCSSLVSLFGGWVHIDDKLDVSCNICGQQTTTLSQGTDSAIAGIEIQRCIKMTPNGGVFSWDHRGAIFFLDDAEGWDLQTGIRYSVFLNSGRSGYVTGGYRFVQLRKSQTDIFLEHAIEGGFVEFGMIF